MRTRKNEDAVDYVERVTKEMAARLAARIISESGYCTSTACAKMLALEVSIAIKRM